MAKFSVFVSILLVLAVSEICVFGKKSSESSEEKRPKSKPGKPAGGWGPAQGRGQHPKPPVCSTDSDCSHEKLPKLPPGIAKRFGPLQLPHFVCYIPAGQPSGICMPKPDAVPGQDEQKPGPKKNPAVEGGDGAGVGGVTDSDTKGNSKTTEGGVEGGESPAAIPTSDSTATAAAVGEDAPKPEQKSGDEGTAPAQKGEEQLDRGA